MSDYVFFESQSAEYIVDVDVGGKGFNLPELVFEALVYFATERLDEFKLRGVFFSHFSKSSRSLCFSTRSLRLE